MGTTASCQDAAPHLASGHNLGGVGGIRNGIHSVGRHGKADAYGRCRETVSWVPRRGNRSSQEWEQCVTQVAHAYRCISVAICAFTPVSEVTHIQILSCRTPSVVSHDSESFKQATRDGFPPRRYSSQPPLHWGRRQRGVDTGVGAPSCWHGVPPSFRESRFGHDGGGHEYLCRGVIQQRLAAVSTFAMNRADGSSMQYNSPVRWGFRPTTSSSSHHPRHCLCGERERNMRWMAIGSRPPSVQEGHQASTLGRRHMDILEQVSRRGAYVARFGRACGDGCRTRHQMGKMLDGFCSAEQVPIGSGRC